MSASAVSRIPVVQKTRRWLQVVSHIDARYGGITASVPRLCAATEESAAYDSPIAGFCEPDETAAADAAITRFPRGRMCWLRDQQLRDSLRQLMAASDGVHIHGIWEEHCSTAAALAAQLRKPYIVSAHGMLEQWAVKSKWLKKALYSFAVERPNLARATCLRALTRSEVDDYRRFGLSNPVALIPNGVDTPPNVASDLFLAKFPELSSSRIVLFLSRLIYKKGLDLLCRAWSDVAQRFPDAHLVIAGPDYGERAALEQLAAKLDISPRLTFAGMLTGDLKWSALSAATAFILPSRSEGFSMAVLEAMACGTPVIITHRCNFPEVADTGCGWVIDAEAPALCGALESCLTAGGGMLRRMGEAGRTLSRTRYSWPAIGRQMAEVYAWIDGGARPRSVEIF